MDKIMIRGFACRIPDKKLHLSLQGWHMGPNPFSVGPGQPADRSGLERTRISRSRWRLPQIYREHPYYFKFRLYYPSGREGLSMESMTLRTCDMPRRKF